MFKKAESEKLGVLIQEPRFYIKEHIMQKRAMGLENEMTLLIISGGQNNSPMVIEGFNQLTRELMISFLKIMENKNFKPGYGICGGENNFLFNGGRIYKDNEALESATSECSSSDEVVDYELANESILLDVLEKADEGFLKNDFSSGLYFEISKKCGDFSDANGGLGCHENYHLEQPLGWKIAGDFNDLNDLLCSLSHYLVPYLVSRSPFVGGGHLDNYGRFIASHRLSVIGSLYNSSNATGFNNKKAMLLIREERGGDVDTQHGKFRLQICSSDSNMSSFCAKFKFGPTSIILRMIEEGFWTKPPVVLADNLRTVKEAATGDADMKVSLANNQRVSLLEINKLYFSAAKKFFESRNKSDEENKIMDMWENTLRIQEKLSSILDKIVDWRILYNFLTAVLERKYGWTWKALQTNLHSGDFPIRNKANRVLAVLQAFNLRYFFLRKNEVRQALKNSGLIDARLKYLDDYSGSPLKFTPPNTRAKWRFDAMNYALKNKPLYHLIVSWGMIIVQSSGLSETSQDNFLENFDPLNSRFFPADFLRKSSTR